jgi:hypothetical protein
MTMNTDARDPVLRGLDELADLADGDHVADRMPGIAGKARATRNRKRVAGALSLVVVAGGAAAALNLAPGLNATKTPSPGTQPSATSTLTQSAMAVLDEAKVDVDGDGTAETVRILAPATAGDQVLEVAWSSGAAQRAGLPNTMERGLGLPLDLDQVGGREIVVGGGGGETSETRVFTVVGGQLVEALYVDASGRSVTALTAGSGDWGVLAGPDGIFSVSNPGLTPLPAPVQVRAWTLSGRTLSESAATTTGCLRGDGLSLEPC